MVSMYKCGLSESNEYAGQFVLLFGTTYVTYNYILFPMFDISLNPIIVFAGTAAAAFACTMMNYRNGSRWLSS